MRAERKALLYALAAILLWGTLAAVTGDALAGLPVATLLFWCFLFAALALSLVHVAQGGAVRELLAGPPALVLLGLWGIFGYHLFLFEALVRAPIVQANLLNYLWPLLVVVLAPILGGEKTNRAALAGAVVGFAGAGLVVTQGRALAVDSADVPGYLLAALAALSWSSFSVLLRRATKPGVDPMPLFVNVSLVAAAMLALARGELFVPHEHALAAAAWIGIGPMAIAFVCWGRAMRLGSAAHIGALSYLDPLLSTLCVALALGKSLSPATWMGMALIIGGAATPAVLALRRR